ncbi:MAG: glycoside hydrolase family 19 [Myxococcales bacterium]|nr:glycoside hydrolase family 19 [Myxococcales bacterium]
MDRVLDKAKFSSLYASSFAKVTRFNLPSMSDLLFVLGKIQDDKRITDVRWAAYILGTMFVETSHTIRLKEQLGARVRPHKPRTVKAWRNFSPVEEVGHGSGRPYFRPVKVKRLQTGDAQVTEWDGDQWTVPAGGGRPVPRSEGAARGSGILVGPPAANFTHDDGVENQYFGRGYVQLTWWDNYVSAGVAVGRGLAFLYEPDLMIRPDLAYEIMALGMVTGKTFANGRRLSQYFSGGHSDYVRARDIVNPGAPLSNKKEVGEIAQLFEKVLLDARSGLTP